MHKLDILLILETNTTPMEFKIKLLFIKCIFTTLAKNLKTLNLKLNYLLTKSTFSNCKYKTTSNY